MARKLKTGSSARARILGAIVAALMAVTGGIATASPAAAVPTNCRAWGDGMYAHAICDGGYGGTYRVFAICQNVMWPHNERSQEGPVFKAGSGQISETRCPFLFNVRYKIASLRA